MPIKLKNKTNLIVKETGRPVFKLDGENVSEKSATIKVDDFYVNLPSIHGNMKYNEDELYDMLMNDEIKATSVHKKHSDAIKAAKERSKNLTIIRSVDKQMGGLLRKPIKAHKGTIVDGQIVYEKDDVESTTSPPKESAPVATPTTTEPAPAVSTPALAVTPPPPPAPTTQQPVQQTVQQPAPQPIPPPPPPPQPVVQPVETPEQAQQVANTFVPENIKQAEQTAPKQALTIKPIALDESKLTDAQKKERAKQQAIMIEQARKKFNESLKKKQQAAATQSPKRLPQPYRPTQEERIEIANLENIIRNSPENKLLQKESNEFNKIVKKELSSYQRKVGEAVRQFGPQSQEFKNALESYKFQERLFKKQYAPTIQRLNKLQLDITNSDAFKNLQKAGDRIFNRNKIQENVPSQFNKGGMSMEQQMSLFEEGGMKDDGLDRDPVSGNEIPPGSLAKEVRDDIPAQLSDGEYVVPADVVQYYGVKFFEDLRAEAKRGLAEMEATGRIGGEPVEVDMTMIAFGQADKDKKEKKATGGVVEFDKGGVSSDMQQIEKSRTFNPADYAVTGFTPVSSISQVRSGVQTSAKPTSTVVYRTYYGPNNEVKSVPGTLDANGNWNANQGFEEFVKSPWTNTPKQQVSSSRDGSGSSALELEAQRRQNEYALGVSAKRLGIPLEEYKNLSLGKRFKLMGQEIQVMSGGKADPKIVKSILDGKDDGFNFTDLIGFIFNPIGSVIKLATSFIAGTDISDSPASNVQLKNEKDLNQSSSKNILPIPSTKSSGVDTSTIKGIEKASKKSDKSDKSDKNEFAKQTGGKPIESDATTAKELGTGAGSYNPVTRAIAKKQQNQNKTAADIDRDVMGGDLNKGGLIQRPKRRNKK